MNGVDLRDLQFQRCRDVLAVVESTATTLCVGRSAYDLAIHLWLIKRDPTAWPGMVVPFLAPLTNLRAQRVRHRWRYEELLDRLWSTSGSIACMPLDRWDDHQHAIGEYYVHTQDVARPHHIDQPAPDDALQEALWLRTRTAARILRRRLPAGLVLEHLDGRRAVIGQAGPPMIVSGPPSELICWVYGRRSVAAVTIRDA